METRPREAYLQRGQEISIVYVHPERDDLDGAHCIGWVGCVVCGIWHMALRPFTAFQYGLQCPACGHSTCFEMKVN